MSLLRGFSQLISGGNRIANIGPILVVGPSRNTNSKMNASTARSAKANKIDRDTQGTLKDLPPKPKKPMSPYLEYICYRKDDILRQNPGMNAAELSKILSKEWKSTDKSAYERNFKTKLDEYKRQIEQYKGSLTDEDRVRLNEMRASELQKKAKRELNKTNIPVLPRSCSVLFIQERSKNAENKKLFRNFRGAGMVWKELFEEYRNLTDAEKQKYLKMQEKDKLRFKREFSEWFDNLQTNDELSRGAHKLADTMREKFENLNYIERLEDNLTSTRKGVASR